MTSSLTQCAGARHSESAHRRATSVSAVRVAAHGITAPSRATASLTVRVSAPEPGQHPLIAVPWSIERVAVRETECAHVRDAALSASLPLSRKGRGRQRRRHAAARRRAVDVLDEVAQPARGTDTSGASQDLG